MGEENRILERITNLDQEWQQKMYEKVPFVEAKPLITAITTTFNTTELNQKVIDQLYGEDDDDNYMSDKYLINVKRFLNSVQLKNKAGKGIKLFSNGKIHITGCKSLLEAYNTASAVVEDINFSLFTEIQIQDFSIQMLNIILKVDKSIKLQQFYEEYVHDESITVKYDPILYSGLIIKFAGEDQKSNCSLTYFSTGTIFCNGLKEPAHLAQAYQHISDIGSAYLMEKIQVIKEKGKRGRKRKAEHAEFYNSLDL